MGDIYIACICPSRTVCERVQVVRIAMDREAFVLKHINGARAPEYLKYLLEYDTVHGRFAGTCEVGEDGNSLIIDGLTVSLSGVRDPSEIPWKDVGVDYVCESTGAFTDTPKCAMCLFNTTCPMFMFASSLLRPRAPAPAARRSFLFNLLSRLHNPPSSLLTSLVLSWRCCS